MRDSDICMAASFPRRSLIPRCRYAVLGVSVFGENDPVLMGTLHIAFLTLFRCATLEDWTDVMYIAMEGAAAVSCAAHEVTHPKPTCRL